MINMQPLRNLGHHKLIRDPMRVSASTLGTKSPVPVSRDLGSPDPTVTLGRNFCPEPVPLRDHCSRPGRRKVISGIQHLLDSVKMGILAAHCGATSRYATVAA